MALFCFPLISHKFEGCAKDNHPENSPRRILLRTLRDVYKACFRQNSPFYIGGDLYCPGAQKHVLRRYALFSTLNPCYSKTARCGILGAILEFPLKIRIVLALNLILCYRKHRSRDLYFDCFPNFGFPGPPQIMTNEPCGKRRITFPGSHAVNLASSGSL